MDFNRHSFPNWYPTFCITARLLFLGIFLRYGYWFNVNTLEWHKKAAPPYEFVAVDPNNLYTVGGRPVLFGNPDCNDVGVCGNSLIYTYYWETDEWVFNGSMEKARFAHEVIEVPKSFCTVAEPLETETAALIVGGYIDGLEGGPTHAKAEIFGCPGAEDRSVRLPDFPKEVYLATGVMTRGPGGAPKAMFCGGFQCDEAETFCPPSNACYSWNRTSLDWDLEEDGGLARDRLAWFAAKSDNHDDASDELVPLLVGNGQDTEIYDPDEGSWTR